MLPEVEALPYHNRSLGHLQGFEKAGCMPLLLGRSRETEKYLYRRENHVRDPFCLFQYTLSGEGVFEDANSKQTPLLPGTGFLVSAPSPTSYWVAPGKEWEFLFLLMRGDVVTYHTHELLREHGHFYPMPDDAPPILRMAQLCTFILRGQEAVQDIFSLSEMTYRFLMALRRQAAPLVSAIPEGLQRARRKLEERYFEHTLSVENLANVAGLSRYHFSRQYKKYFGQSPYAALLQFRLNRAMENLTTTERPLKQIAHEVGFSDYAYFGRMFRQVFGQTPGDVKRRRIL